MQSGAVQKSLQTFGLQLAEITGMQHNRIILTLTPSAIVLLAGQVQ